MIFKDDLKKIIVKQKEQLNRELGIPRDNKIVTRSKFVTIISGIRRCGKSTLARQILHHKKKVYYLNFEDINLTGFELRDFIRLEQAFNELTGEGGAYFFDEIQNVNEWEKYIRQLTDRGEEIIITGSNASLLSSELGTKLTGRQITKELYPFSYSEFLKIKKQNNSSEAFEAYLVQGGFPEYLKSEDKEIIRNLFQDIIYRDILQRKSIRNESAVKLLIQHLLPNIGKPISYNRLKTLIQAGSGNTITEYIHSFEQAYLLFSVNKFDYSVRKQIVNPKKIYCIDNAIIGLNAFTFSENKGRLLENSVFIELKRREEEVYYFQGTYECDFITFKSTKVHQVIQVTWHLNNDNEGRELGGMKEALDKFNINEGLILTFDQEDILEVDRKVIRILPVRKWMQEI